MLDDEHEISAERIFANVFLRFPGHSSRVRKKEERLLRPFLLVCIQSPVTLLGGHVSNEVEDLV